VIKYEEMVRSPEDAIQSVWENIGISTESLSEHRFEEASTKAVPDGAPWQSVSKNIGRKKSKFADKLTKEERKKIKNRLSEEVKRGNIQLEKEVLSYTSEKCNKKVS